MQSENKCDMNLDFIKNGYLKLNLERITTNPPLLNDMIEIECFVNFKECGLEEYYELTTGIKIVDINTAIYEKKQIYNEMIKIRKMDREISRMKYIINKKKMLNNKMNDKFRNIYIIKKRTL